MCVREATLTDQPRVLEMATRFLAESPYGRLFPVDLGRLAVLMQMCVELGVIFVAEKNGGVVGMIALVALTDPIGGVRYADEIAWWVEPDHRDSNIGGRLMCTAQRWVRARRLAFLKMVAPADAPRVAAFYQALGFTAVETAYIKRF